MQQLFTKWGKQLDHRHILTEYPRPLLVRGSYMNLNGVWKYAFTKSGHRPETFEGRIIVPFSPESPLSGVNRQLQPDEYLWYHRRFFLEKWDNICAGHRLILHFGAVDQSCMILINGQKADVHTGGYLPFEIDISSLVHNGNNTLELAVKDLSDTSYHSRGKQRLNRGGMFYTVQSGIWQTVWMEIVPDCYIRQIETTPDIENSTITFRISNGGFSSSMLRIRIRQAEIYDAPMGTPGNPDTHSSGKIIAEISGKTGEEITLSIPSPLLWTCETPYLYYFTVQMGEDLVESYFSMRKFTIEKDQNAIPRICLNGKAIFLNGVLDQGYWPDGLYTAPSDEAMIFDIKEMKKTGFNMIRKHLKIEPQRWYYHCDRLGMIVWQDMVNGGGNYKYWLVTYLATLFSSWMDIHLSDRHARLLARNTEAGRLEFIKEVKETVLLLKNHPSISTWVIFNEGWGQFETRKLTEMVKKLDPHRLIDSASGWFDQKCGDFKSVHNYFFPLKIVPEKDRAFVVSETGGYTYRENGHCACKNRYGYKDYKSKKALNADYKKLTEKMRELASSGLCASIYTQWTDIEDEINGVYTYDREIRKIDALS